MQLPPLSPEQAVKPPRYELRMSLLFAAMFLPMGSICPIFPSGWRNAASPPARWD